MARYRERYTREQDISTYQLIISVSPSNCSPLANGMFFAYVPAIYNQELNIGGLLKTGEIIVCNYSDSCEG